MIIDSRFNKRFPSPSSAARGLLWTALVIGIGGCTAFPTQGPTTSAIQGAALEQNPAEQGAPLGDYILVRINASNIGYLNGPRLSGLSSRLRSTGSSPEIRIGIGDTVAVTIFEAGAGGLFSPPETSQLRSGNFVELPAQTVDRNGNISVPYAGQIRAAGLRPDQVQATIVERLRNRAIEPQAVVALRDQRATQLSVLGQVNQPNKFSINPSGERVLDAIARAGGIKNEGYESFVTLQRGSSKATVPFNSLVSDPSSNIFVQPGDVVYVSREVQSFVAIGASKQNGQVNFEAASISLAQALGKTAGLLDDRADPTSLYVYRFEDAKLVHRMGFDVSKFSGGSVPVIYMLDFRDPAAPHIASQFQMANKDILYISNAATVEVTKFLNFIRAGTGIVSDVRKTSTN